MCGRYTRRWMACRHGAHLDGFDQLVHDGIYADRAAAAAAADHWDAGARWHDRVRSGAVSSGCCQHHHARCVKHLITLLFFPRPLLLCSYALDTEHQAGRDIMLAGHMSRADTVGRTQ